ncbi:bud emergence protein 1 [Mucor velutinosus]|uniref:Bud emergence protein 1 n=1 Tax=Mucor velutinosus TaxID=708070 RepID=A0AAN7HUD2_9FUNG|nr:bud emergence protein 1 [Mucor velutinosus]
MATQYYSSSAASEKLEEIDEEQLMWQSEHAAAHHHHHHHHHHIPEEDEDDDSEEDELMIEDASSMSSSPSIPDENINFDLVYALHTFVATVEGQASVVKGDALILMEDTNIYWWLVEVLKTREVGYIPAENIETPYERLARLNKHRNVEITSPSIHDTTPLPLVAQHPLNPTRRVTIGDESMSKIFHYEVESEIDEDEDQERYEEMDEDDLSEENHDQTHTDNDHASETQQHQEEFHEMIMDPEEQPVETKQEWQEKSWDIEDTQQPTEIPSTSTTCSTLEQNSEEEQQPQTMELRVFAGNIGQGPLFHTFYISLSTTADELVKTSVQKFGMNINMEPSENTTIEYYLAVQGMDGDEYVLSAQDKPFSIFKTLTDSLTTPMPSFSHIKRISQQLLSSLQSRNSTSRRPRSSSFSNYEQTNYDEDSVIRFYLHRRIKRAHEREGLLYIKVSLYPDETSIITSTMAGPQPAFTKNPTVPKSSKMSKKRQQQQQQIRSEIDRIDKIISVRQESLIGAVINLALEKFHVPDAVADDYQAGNPEQLQDSRQLGKYKMSVRGHGQETELNPNELMSNVLLQQKSSSPNHSGPITSDLLFVLRKAGSAVKKPYQKERHLGMQKSNQVNPLPPLSISQQQQQQQQQSDEYTRRPSILDILMDAAPKMGERRPSVMSSLLEPPPRLTEDNRRPSGLNNINQERKSHQQQYIQQASPSSSSSSSFPTSTKSPNSILGFNRRSSAQSSSVLSSSSIDEQQLVNSDSTLIIDHLEVTPTSSSSIMRPSNTNSTDSRKKESFKQQFKRFVGWGSSSSASTKKQANIPPPLTTPFSTQSDLQSPSEISFVSAPSTPLPPTPGTPRSFLPANPKSRQGSASHPLEVSTPIMSRRPSEATALNDPSAAAMAAAAAVTAANKRLSTVSSVSSSTASSVTSEEIAAAAHQGLMMADTNDDDSSDDEDQQERPTSVSNGNSNDAKKKDKGSLEQSVDLSPQQAMQAEVTTPRNAAVEEPNDIQVQYAMWMNSQTNVNIPEEEASAAPILPAKSPASSIITVSSSAILTKALPPVTPHQPAKSPLRSKSSNISNATTATANMAPSVVATTPAQSTCATTATPSIASANTKTEIEEDASSIHQQQQQQPPHQPQQKQQQQQQLEPLHPMPSNNGQDLDDLFLLVAHGVDFLTIRENTKWEEEGGYDFHPWNRPQSSFAVRQQEQQQQQRNKDVPPLPVDYTSQRNQSQDGSNGSISGSSASMNGNHETAADNTSAALTMARSLLLSPAASEEQQQQQQQKQNKPISPPLTPLPQQPLQENPQEEHVQQPQQQESPLSMAKRILGAKVEIPSPSAQPVAVPQQHQSVDDEELQRIVASHIVF